MLFFGGGKNKKKTKSPRKDDEFNYIDSKNIVQKHTGNCWCFGIINALEPSPQTTWFLLQLYMQPKHGHFGIYSYPAWPKIKPSRMLQKKQEYQMVILPSIPKF